MAVANSASWCNGFWCRLHHNRRLYSVAGGLILIIVSLAAAAIVLRFNHFEMMKIVNDVKVLERRINDLAGGEELLSHESRGGLAAEGHAARWRQFLSGRSN